MISVPGDTRPATPVPARSGDDHPTDTSGVSAFAPQLPAVDRDQRADCRSQLEAHASHRSNAQRRREVRAAAHAKQTAAAAKRTATAVLDAPAAELPTPCRTKHPVGVKRCVLCDAHAEQAALAKAAALKAPLADDPADTLAERAAQTAEFKAALAKSRVTPEAQQALADALHRHRDPKAAQEALQARQKAATTDRTTPASPTQPQPAAPQTSPDGGTPGKAERFVAASTAETGSDLREGCDASVSCDSEPTPETSDLGKQYEQANNKLQKSMRLLDEARAITTLFSMRKCGVDNIAGAVAVTQKIDGSGGFNGLFRCGSVWSCPECMPVVRADRAAVMEKYALAWATEHDAELCTGKTEDAGKTHAGHGMAMATFTSRHGEHAVLEDRLIFDKHGKPVKDDDGKQQVRRGQLQRTADAWRRMLQSRWWRRLRAKYGIVGATRALEVTHSWASAWHTHIHAVVWFEEPVTDDVAKELETELYVRWQAECTVAGLGRPSRKHGVKVDPARRGAEGAADIAKYLVKVQDKDKAPRPAAEGFVNHVSRDARPTADQARRLKAARAKRDTARAQGKTRAQADADSLIADIREEIGQAHRARALGNELLRGDNKVGRKEGRTALEILRLALAGDAAELDLWHQYERATKGTKMLTWTGDVRERLERLTGAAAERDAQEVMAEDDAKQVKAVLVLIDPDPWKSKVAAIPGRRGQLRVAVKVASDNAIKAGLDMEAGARAAVRELLESWGLTWDTDMYGPGTQTKGSRGVDTETGELYFVPEHPAPPQDRRDRRHPQWQTPDQLHANATILGTTPRDYVRPEQAARRASGLPIARELTTPTTDSTPATTKTLCIVCDIPVNPSLPEPLHLLCDPFTTS
ncbi:hypothetical protein [Streptomyces sp. NBC_01233]|uniref:hypothetical protein n=1 Tax=Streptomyces sp. NBC_01233 TaxID=2903787 RepID=UPI002E11F184|nr:hypothetical protein OG332_47650 [Streptomyces sp. NBC_01233]